MGKIVDVVESRVESRVGLGCLTAEVRVVGSTFDVIGVGSFESLVGYGAPVLRWNSSRERTPAEARAFAYALLVAANKAEQFERELRNGGRLVGDLA